jgi:hypothetical protein
MPSTVHWRLMYRVSNRAAFDRCLARTVLLIDDGYSVGECGPYWKIPELWECALRTPVTTESVAEQIHACLTIAYRLASGWYVLGSLTAESANGFNGVFALGDNGARSYVVGLEWASFVLVAQETAAPSVPSVNGGV